MLLFDLCDTPGVSSTEDAVRDLLARFVRPYVDALQVDSIGNLIVLRRATAARRAGFPQKVLLTAHMDEPGLMVTHVKNGDLSLGVVGQVDPRGSLGKRVMVGPERLPGILISKPAHHVHDERNKMPDLAQIPLEMGGDEGKVKLAQTVAFAGRAELLGQPVNGVEPIPRPHALPGQGRVKARALSSRAGCAILAELLASGPELAYDLWVAFTVQEEVGLRGARVIGNRLNSDLALVIAGAPADDDYHGSDVPLPTTQLGQGVALPRRNRGHVVHPGLHAYLTQVCEARNIPWQPMRNTRSSSEAGPIARAGAGQPVATVMIPVRYAESPLGIMDLGDYHAAAALIQHSLADLMLAKLEL